MPELFRPEAVNHASRRLHGEVVLASPLSLKLLSAFAVAVVVFAAIFLSTVQFARKETVLGWIAPQGGMIRVVGRQGGLIEEINVSEGEVVAAGQPLALVRLSQDIAGGSSYELIAGSLDEQRRASAAQGYAAQLRLEAEQQQLGDRISSLTRDLDEARQRLSLQARRAELANNEFARAQAIAGQGYMSRRDLDSRQLAALSAEQELSSVRASIEALERQLSEARVRLDLIPVDLAAAAASSAGTAAQLAQQATQTESQSSYVVTAPIAGRVAALPFVRSQSIPSGGTVAIMSAEHATLEAELYAPSRAIGFVKPGQEVRLMYQAFPHQKFGAAVGYVTSVSRTVLAPTELSVPGIEAREPVFRVRVRLAKASVSAYGQDIPLRPGMLLTADIIADRRSLLEWLLDPLYAAGRR